MRSAHFKTGWIFLWITVVVFIVDRLTKELARIYLDPYVPIAVIPSLNFTLAYNTGAAFSFLNTGSFWPNILFGSITAVISIIIIKWLYSLPRQEYMINTALTLILGGALGNLWDRIQFHHVIDFIDCYVNSWHWPIFNVADAAVSIGAVLLMGHWFRARVYSTRE